MVVNVQVYCSFIGNTGWNNHVRDFLSSLDHSIVNVKVTNFTVDDNFKGLTGKKPFEHLDYLTDRHRSILHEQLLWDDKTLKRFPIYSYQKDFKPDVNLVFAEVDHHLYYQDFYDENIPKIAYTVWESTKLPENFMKKLMEFDELWVPSKWQKDCHVEQGYPEHKMKIVNEGVDSKLFKPKVNPVQNNKMKFFMVGRWDYRKSTKDIIRTWIDTFSSNENVELILSVDNFDNPQDNFKNTQERLIAYGLNDKRISIVSYSDRNTYINRLKNSDVFLSCSRGEGWNLPLIEAMACGIPVIYSQCGGQLEYTKGFGFGVKIKHEVTAWKENIGNVYEPDFELLSDTLRKIHSKYERAKKRAIIESDRVRKEYDWSVCGKLGTNYLTRVRKFSEQINPTFVTHVRPHENLESMKDNWMPKVNKNKGKFIISKIDWNDVFICNGKDATSWGTNEGYGATTNDFTIMMRGDIFPDYHIGNEELNMIVKFFDMDSQTPDVPVSQNTLRPGYWCRAGRKWFTRWRVTVEDQYTGQVCFEYKLDSLKGMNVLVHSVFGLGDTLAWFPYTEEFRKKHDCNIFYHGGYSHWLRDKYPEINFIDKGNPSPKCHLGYELGWNHMYHAHNDLKAYEPFNKHFQFPNDGAPRNYQTIPLQASAADTLGIEYTGYLRTHITEPQRRDERYRPIKEKYVTICTQSTTQAKYWNYGWDYEKMWTPETHTHIHHGDGWHRIIEYLDTIGYKVVVINQYRQYGSPDVSEDAVTEHLSVWNLHDFTNHPNVIDKTNDYISLEDRMIDLMHAEFHIGLNSGMSWVAKTLGVPVIMIPGLHPPEIIPIAEKYVHQTDPDLCTDCGMEYPFVRGDWGHCPKYQKTEREFECTATITPDMVVEKIDELIAEKNVSSYTEEDFVESFNKTHPFVCRVEHNPHMLGSYIATGMVIGFFDECKILSRNSKEWSTDLVGKKLGRSVNGDVKYFRNDISDNVWNGKQYEGLLYEYNRLTGFDNLIVTNFSKRDVPIATPDNAMKFLMDRDVDMLVMGDYLYSPAVYDHDIDSVDGKASVLQEELIGKDNKDSFTKIYHVENSWDSPCGYGSLLSVVEDRNVIPEIQRVIKEYNVKSVNMVGGGIFGNWEYKIDYDKLGVDYHGYDIVDDEVERNKKEFPNYNFSQLDMITDVCRKADLIICREVIQHLSSNQVINSIENFKKSGSKYLLINNWNMKFNYEIFPNDFIRGYSFYNPKNLLLYPYNMKPPFDSFVEKNTGTKWTHLSPLYDLGREVEDITIDDPVQRMDLFSLQ